MEAIRKFVKNVINEYLNENIQLADKIYFNTEKLSQEDKNIILGITKGNNYTKIITDFYYYLKQRTYISRSMLIERINLLYNDVLNYNRNVFPIIGYDVYNLRYVPTIIGSLEERRNIINELKKLPSIAQRNLKEDIRKERNLPELNKYFNDLSYFMAHLSLLSNRSEDIQIKFLKKMFKNGSTLEQLMRFVDEKESFLGGINFTKDSIKQLAQIEDIEIIYEQDNAMIIKVYSPSAIKAIGCNSLWCFTYGSEFDNAYRQWDNYSYNGIVYVLVDFSEESDSENFMHVLIKPLTDENNKLIKYTDENEDEVPLYNMSNENYYNPYLVLKSLFGKNYKKVINTYLNFEY